MTLASAYLEFAPGLDVELSAQFVGDNDLKFGRYDDGFHPVFLTSCATVALSAYTLTA